ncbi:uncharacterized protein LOC131860195 [Cryptomeria japonica]|uniref:uncharacterized protein LOC131860195 n=1 Tax=Cryptomeria japonica TaxID=3369 RepID=UPI0027DA5866|nr:uncharacterized protein LOC131860195 [Cryptomeria japonica]
MQAQLCEEIHLKEEYARQLSDIQVILSEEKARFKTELHGKEDSLEKFESKFLDMEVLLQRERDLVSQLQQTLQHGSAKILSLEDQVVLEQDRCKMIQQKITTKSKEVSQLLNIPSTIEVSQYFSLILAELLAEHARKPKSYPIAHQGLILLFYEHLKGKARANREDPLVENAHIFEGHEGSESDEDSSNIPLHKKVRVVVEAKDDMEVKVGFEEEQEKAVEVEAESEKKEVEGEEEHVQRKEYFEELEVSDSRNEAQHTTKEKKQRDLDDKIQNLIKDTNTIGKKDTTVDTSEAEDEEEMQDWPEKEMIKGYLKHLEDVIIILKEKGEVSSHNMNALVACLEKNKQNKEMVIIDDVSTTSSAPHSSRRRTRQTTSDLEMKTKDTHQMQDNKDLKEVANAMMMLAKNAEESIKVFI